MTVELSELALVDYFQRGGFWMWALLACSLLALAVIIYKTYDLWRAGWGTRVLVDEVSRLLDEGATASAVEKCQASSASVGAVIGAVLSVPGRNREVLREQAQMAGSHQLALLESGLPGLSTVANVAPLIGFLGTVSGMIRAFTAIAEHGLGEPGIVAAGIGEALITTASGLIVAIPCFIAYSYFVSRVNGLGLNMELTGAHFLNLLTEGPDRAAPATDRAVPATDRAAATGDRHEV